MTTPIEEKAKNVLAVEVEEGKQPSEAPVVDLGDASGGDTKVPDISKYKAARNARMYTIQRSHGYEADAKHPTTAGISKEDWKALVIEQIEAEYKNNADIEWFAYIFHDKDERADGDPVAIHVHIVVRYKKPVPHSVPYDGFKASRMENCQKVDSPLRICRYLTHISSDAIEKEKHVYSQKDVVVRSRDGKLAYKQLIKESFWGKTSKKDTLESLKKETDANGFPLLVIEKAPDALLVRSKWAGKVSSGEVHKSDAVDGFKREAGTHWASFWRVTFDHEHGEWKQKERKRIEAEHRDLRMAYGFGAGASGKTSNMRGYAKWKAANSFIAVAPGGKKKTFDPFSLYDGERIVIFDEVKGQSFGLEEWLTLTDPKNASVIPRRNKDTFFIGDTFLLTNSVNPLKFVNDLIVYSEGGSEYQDKTNPTRIDRRNTDALGKEFQAFRRFSSLLGHYRNPNTGKTEVRVFNWRYGPCAKAPDAKGVHSYAGMVEFGFDDTGAPVFHDGYFEELDALMAKDLSAIEPTYLVGEYIAEYDGCVEERSPLEQFVDEVVSECRWTLLPTKFLFALYDSYMKTYHAYEKRLDMKNFLEAVAILMPGWEGPEQYYSKGHMDNDEPLITEYKLGGEWIYNAKSTRLSEYQLRRFNRKERYRGFRKL